MDTVEPIGLPSLKYDRPLDLDDKWVDRKIGERITLPTDKELIDALTPLMRRIVSYQGLYAGDYPRDAAIRVVSFLRQFQVERPGS